MDRRIKEQLFIFMIKGENLYLMKRIPEEMSKNRVGHQKQDRKKERII